MRSITNKIALMLIAALVVSFAAISAVSYYTAENKVVELVSQNQNQILNDVQAVFDFYFDEYLDVVQRFAKNFENASDNEDEPLEKIGRAHV